MSDPSDPIASLPLSKVMAPAADYPRLADALALVDRHWTHDQASEHRRWEYAMAIEAIWAWARVAGTALLGPREILDVGGAGSPFCFMATDLARCEVIDPKVNGLSLIDWVAARRSMADVVTCLSVLEHIPPRELDRVCYHLGAIVAPGGLLVITVDYAEDGTTDPHHLHWMREQIFDFWKLNALRCGIFHELGFAPLGPVDYSWPGRAACVYPNYTFASLALRRRP